MLSTSMADGSPHPDNNENNKNQQAEDRIPFSLEAEQAVLGAILFDNEVYYRVSSYLKAEHFHDPIHALIYDACGGLIGRNSLASPVMVNNYLNSSEGFIEAGGTQYLERLAANVPASASAHNYARLVFDLSVRRGLMKIGGELIDRAQTSSLEDETARQLQDAEQSLYNLAETGKYGGGFKSFRASIAEAIDLADAAVKRDGGLAGIATGMRDLDTMMGGLHPSDLIILAARPSMGKTSLAVNVAVNVAKAYKAERQEDGTNKAVEGGVVGLFSLEMAAEQLATRIIAEESGVPSNLIRRGEVDEAEFDRIYDAARNLEALPLHIDDTAGISIADLAARARRLKRQHGLDLLIVDYLQLLSGSGRRSDNRVQEITEISIGLKSIAKELNVPVIALSQLSRQVENREDKRPQLSDLRESGSIEQDADVVMFIYREEYYLKRSMPHEGHEGFAEAMAKVDASAGIADVIIGKQRHGPIGTVQLQFQEELTKFSNLDRGIYDDHRREEF